MLYGVGCMVKGGESKVRGSMVYGVGCAKARVRDDALLDHAANMLIRLDMYLHPTSSKIKSKPGNRDLERVCVRDEAPPKFFFCVRV